MGHGGAVSATQRRPTNKICMGILGVLDQLISIVFITPFVVGYWRGCWQLLDVYLLPENFKYSVFTSLAIGLGSGIFFTLIQGPLTRGCDHERRPRLHLFVSRLYTFIYCFCCVNHWRGVWAAWDIYTGITWKSGLLSTSIGYLVLCLTRGLNNILAPPFYVCMDAPDGYFTVPTLFRTKKERCGYFLLDSLFTVIFTVSLVVFVWRGTWVFMDDLLFPQKKVYSAWGSLALGCMVTILVVISQLVMIPCLRRIRKGVGKVLLEDSYHSICFVGTINIWRGVWMLLDLYLLPDHRAISNAASAVIGIVVLMIFYTGNSILVRGAEMDGVKDGSKGVIFPNDYLRFFYKRGREDSSQREYWVQESVPVRAPLKISSPLESALVTKINGIDGRGYGDGHSFSDGFGENVADGFVVTTAFSEERRVSRPNSTFLSSDNNDMVRESLIEESSLMNAITKDLHQTETPL